MMLVLTFGMIMPSFSMNINAATTDEAESGSWKEKNGKKYYYVDQKRVKGFYKINKKTYYFDSKGVMRTGWQKIENNKYYFNSQGIMQTGFTEIKNKTYYFDKNGIMKKGWQTIKKQKYYFDSKGVMRTGWQKIRGKKYYFNSKGIMQKGWKTIKGKRYYFDSKGIMQTGFKTIRGKKYYLNKNGGVLTGWQTIKSKRYYFDSKGVMQTGLKTIKNKTYYFDKSSGIMAKNKTIKSGSAYYYFDSKGVMDLIKSYCMAGKYKMHIQYRTDPKVSDEKLLAAIIYSEAGNQKQYPVTAQLDGEDVTVYKGHLAVGYVIANRLKDNLGYKEVIYQTYQFEPARTGVLTKYLKNYNLVSKDCINAAKIVLNDVENDENSVKDFDRSSFEWKNFWALSYANKTSFFSTYDPSEYEIMQGHVFFNYTKTIN